VLDWSAVCGSPHRYRSAQGQLSRTGKQGLAAKARTAEFSWPFRSTASGIPTVPNAEGAPRVVTQAQWHRWQRNKQIDTQEGISSQAGCNMPQWMQAQPAFLVPHLRCHPALVKQLKRKVYTGQLCKDPMAASSLTYAPTNILRCRSTSMPSSATSGVASPTCCGALKKSVL
jgi:hypothetical protein